MILLLLYLSQLFSFTPAFPNTSTPQPTVVLDSVHVQPDSTFILPVRFQGLDSLPVTAYQFSFSYDTAFIEIDSINTTGTQSESGLVQANMDTPGILNVAAALNQPLSASGVLLELHVKATDETGSIPLRFDSFMFNEGEGEINFVDGQIAIEPWEPDYILSADTIRVHTNQTAELPIHISSSSEGLYSGSFSIQFDPDLIQEVEIALAGTLLGIPEALVDFSIPSPGIMDVIFASSSPLAWSGVPLMRLVFDSTEEYGQSSVQFHKVKINENDQAVSTRAGLVSIIPPFIFGDTNEDEEISYIDAVLILRHLLQLAHLEGDALDAADVSGNQQITSYDASLILRFIAGDISCFPVSHDCPPGKRFLAVEEAQHHTAPTFYWNRLFSASTLMLEQASSRTGVYSLDVSIAVGSDSHAPPDIQSLLPAEWIMTSRLSNGVLSISLAGPTPLLPGPIFSVEDVIHQAQISVNGMPTPTSAEMSVAPDIQITALYPTPFKHTAHLYYSLSHSVDVKITLYDVLGRRVHQPFSGFVDAGEHHVRIGGESLSSGLYVLHLVTSDGLYDETYILKRE